MQNCIRLFCLTLFLLTGASVLRAQDFPNGEIGVQLGGMFYLGDINNVPFKSTRPAVGAFYRHNINVRYSAKALLSYGRITASDSNYKSEYQNERGYSFKRDCAHLSILGEFNFLQFAVGKHLVYIVFRNEFIGES